MRYRNTEKEIKTIGKELDVNNILTGSVQVENDRIRIRGELVNAENGTQIWSDVFDHKMESLFKVQDQVSDALIRALKLKLSPADVDPISQPSSSQLAYEYYLQGMNFLNSRYMVTNQDKDFKSALEMFNKALDLEPDYIQALWGRTLAYGFHYAFTHDLNLYDEFKKMRIDC
jgi:adenylate cyclase